MTTPNLRHNTVAVCMLAGIAFCNCAVAAIPASEREVLDDIYFQSIGSHWTNHNGWEGPAGSECSWYGVTCDSSQAHVLRIDLSSNKLIGSLPPDISGLTDLQYFNVGGNLLTGSIPTPAGLSSLTEFHVDNNALTGSVPDLPATLTKFSASYNQLTGSIPTSLVTLTNLQYFWVDVNHLTGSIPSLPNTLSSIRAGYNALSGVLPSPPAALTANNSNLCSNTSVTMGSNFSENAAWSSAIGGLSNFVSCSGNPSVTISPSASTSGSISPSTAQNIPYGATTSFNVVPNSGYAAVVTGTCGGMLSGATFTINPATGNCSVTVTFAAIYGVGTSVGSNGSMTLIDSGVALNTIPSGTILHFAVIPSNGYVANVSGCGGVLSASIFTTAAISSACTVTAVFVPVHVVMTSISGNGSMTLTDSGISLSSVPDGTTLHFHVTPLGNNQIGSVNGCGGVLSGSTYTTAPITGACTVTATFTPMTFPVTTTVGANGTMTLKDSGINLSAVPFDTTLHFLITPNTGFVPVFSVNCGGSTGLYSDGWEYNTSPIEAACSVVVNFTDKVFANGFE